MLKNTRAIRFARNGASKGRSEEGQADEDQFNLDQDSVSADPVNVASSSQTVPVKDWPRRILERMTSGVLRSWRHSTARPARLAVIERIALGPKQSLMLVEADGVRLLVATSSEAASAFFPLPSQADAIPAEDGVVQSPAVSSGLPQTGSARNLRSNTGPAMRPSGQAFRRSVNEPPSGLWFESRISW